MIQSIEVTTDAESRLDAFLSTLLPEISRSHIAAMIKSGNITVNGKGAKASFHPAHGDIIRIEMPDEPEETAIEPENIALDVVYEDADVIVINKPKDMVVHPACGHEGGTLVNALLYHCNGSLSGINGQLRPGIVHRIDKDTTGLLIACKNDQAHNRIAEQLRAHTITRRYVALVHGNLKEDAGTVSLNIERSRTDRKKMAPASPGKGRVAVTHYRVLERFGDYTLIECRLETGRTHQIRVHMSYLHHPLCGDPLYGQKNDKMTEQGQFLHAAVLGFVHPVSGKYMEFQAPLPAYFEDMLKKLRSRA